MKIRSQKRYLPFVAIALLALLFALWVGLLRLGWSLPALSGFSQAHGPLMVSGFLGTLIALERAVAIRQKWMFAVPLIIGLGWICLLTPRRAASHSGQPRRSGYLERNGTQRTKKLHHHNGSRRAGLADWEYFMADWAPYLSNCFLVDSNPDPDHRWQTARTQPHPASYPASDSSLRTVCCRASDRGYSRSL